MFYEILPAVGIIGLGMLLGGAVYESIVMAPNYRADVPESLVHLRQFMKVTTPANYFRVFSPVTMLFLILTVIICWGFVPARWWFAGALAGHIVADSITFIFHYPRNKVLFIDSLSSDHDLLRRLAKQWAQGNNIRILFIVIALISAICGMISLVKV